MILDIGNLHSRGHIDQGRTCFTYRYRTIIYTYIDHYSNYFNNMSFVFFFFFNYFEPFYFPFKDIYYILLIKEVPNVELKIVIAITAYYYILFIIIIWF